jgi:hypothetical protein
MSGRRGSGFFEATEREGEPVYKELLRQQSAHCEEAVRRVSDLLDELSGSREPLPDPADVSRKLGVGVPLDGKTTVSDWLDRWMAGKKTRPTTNRGYQSHVRYHLKPKIGHDRLTVGHLADMFAKIADESDVIRAENQARPEQHRLAGWGEPGM